jgi:hypothetical protein
MFRHSSFVILSSLVICDSSFHSTPYRNEEGEEVALLWLSCPHCRVYFHIDEANAGKQVACRACGNPIRIPGTAPKMPVWHYTRERHPKGPVTFEQLRELARTGELNPGELVWQEGMAQWAEARTIDGLYPSPPPVPAATAPPETAVVSPQEEQQPVIEIETEEQRNQPVEMPAKIDESPVVVEEEPLIEIVDEEQVEPPIPIIAEPEQNIPKLSLDDESSSKAVDTSAEQFLPKAWDTPQAESSKEEQQIEVEPEFALNLPAAPPVRRPEPAPTVDLVFPKESAQVPERPALEIELAPVEPKMELDEPEPEGFPTPYEVSRGWKKSQEPKIEVVPEPGTPGPETYAVAGAAQAATPPAQPISAIPVAEIVDAAPPMAIPVSADEVEPREETELERRSRLRREYVQAKKEWTAVRSGLNIIYLTSAGWFGLIAVRFIINTAIAIIAGESPSQAEQSGAGSGVSIAILFIMAVIVDSLTIYGLILCLKIPETTGGRTLIISTLVLTGVSIFFALLAPFVTVMALIALIAGFCRWFAFVFFLQTVNQFFEAHLQMKSIERLMLLMGSTVGIAFVLWVGMNYLVRTFASGEMDTAAMITLILASLCTNLPLLVLIGLCTLRYLRVLRDTVALIDERIYRGELG